MPARLLLAALTLAAAPALAGPAPRAPADSTPVQRLERHLELNFEGREIPGAAMAVVQDGRVLMARGFGVTSAKHGARVGPETLFRLGSTTKMFVAATALTLAEEARLDLGAPISPDRGAMP